MFNQFLNAIASTIGVLCGLLIFSVCCLLFVCALALIVQSAEKITAHMKRRKRK